MDYIPYGFIIFYSILSLIVCVNFTVDVVGGRQAAQSMITDVKEECNQFKVTIGNFPDGIMIAKVEYPPSDLLSNEEDEHSEDRNN